MCDYHDHKRSNSIYSSSYNDNDAISILRCAIRAADKSNAISGLWFDQNIPISNDQYEEWGVVIQNEQILIDRKINSVRKVYLTNSKYRVGWILDSDLHLCMVCYNYFNFLRRKHHCRCCGSLVCSKCSPYLSNVPNIEEEGGSRVCVNCFGLKSSSTEGSSPVKPLSTPDEKDVKFTPIGTVRRRTVTSSSGKSQSSLPIDALRCNDLELFEKLQEPKYEEAYRKMRQIIPLDIYKSNHNRLLEQGLPSSIADRIWNNKILWLIVMHPEDISKVHLADFRGKYVVNGLDIVELRAVWYCLPVWNADGKSPNALERGKAEWKSGVKARLDDYNYKESRDTLPEKFIRNDAYEGYDDLHLFDSSIVLKTRFDRSASFVSEAVESPVPSSRLKGSSKLKYDTIIPFGRLFDEQNALIEGDDDDDGDDHFNDDVHCIVDGAGTFEFESVRTKYENYQSFKKEEKYSTLLEEINAEGEVENYDISDLELEPTLNNSIQRREDLVEDGQDIDFEDAELEDERNDDENYLGIGDGSSFQTPLTTAKKQLITASMSPIVGEKWRERHLQDVNTPYLQSTARFAHVIEPVNIENIHFDSPDTNVSKFSSSSAKFNPLTLASTSSQSVELPTSRNHFSPSVSRVASTVASRSAEFLSSKNSSSSLQSLKIEVDGQLKSSSGVSNQETTSQKNSYYHRPTVSLSSNSSSNSTSLPKPSDSSLQGSSSRYDLDNSFTTSSRNQFPSFDKFDGGGDFCDASAVDADAMTLTTKDTNSLGLVERGMHSKTANAPKSLYREEEFSDAFDAAPSEISESTFGNYNNLLHNNNLTAFVSEANSENDSKASSSTMETPLSVVPASVTSSEDPVDFMRSVESRSSYKERILGKSFNQDTEDEYVLPKALIDEMDSADQANFSSPEKQYGSSDGRMYDSFSYEKKGALNTFSAKSNRSVRKETNALEMALSFMHNGDIQSTESLVATYGTDIFSSLDATKLLLQLAMNLDKIPDPINTFIILIDIFKADVNAVDGEGRTALHHVIFHSELGSLLLMRGADILLCDDSGTCPLSLSLNYNQEWLLLQFEASGRESFLLQHGSTYQLFSYTTYLILAGHSSRAAMVINLARVVITSDDATALMSSCKGNFANMKEPVETFELLESLGARMDDIC